MSSLKANNGDGSELRLEQQKDTMWPALGDSTSRSRGSSPQLKSGSEMVKGASEARDAASLEKLPSNKTQTLNSTYSAAVGVGNMDSQLKIMEEDGERIGIIPEDIMKDSKPLWTDLLAGKFPSKFPSLRDIFLTVNNIWTLGNRNIKIEVYKVSETLVKFRIPDKSTRDRVLKRGMWSISGLPMILSKWAPIEELEEIETKVVPIWITMKNVPRSLFHWKGLSCIAKVVGKPIKLHPDTIQCVKFDEAKILVEADINAQLPKAHKYRSDLNGIFGVEFLYPWVPRRCSECFKWGHSADVCVEKTGRNSQTAREEITKQSEEETKSVSDKSLAVHVTTDSSSVSLIKRNSEGSSSKFVQEDLTEKELMSHESIRKDENKGEVEESSKKVIQEDLSKNGGIGNVSQEKVERKRTLNSNQMEGSYIKAAGKKIITAEEALEEIRLVKEGLRQVSPYSSTQKQNQTEENQIGLQYVKTPQWNKDTKEIKDFQIPVSNSRQGILAESIEEMEMMISNEDSNYEEDLDESKEMEYDSQIEKMSNGKAKNKTKEKEGKQPGTKGRGRGRGRGKKSKR